MGKDTEARGSRLQSLFSLGALGSHSTSVYRKGTRGCPWPCERCHKPFRLTSCRELSPQPCSGAGGPLPALPCKASEHKKCAGDRVRPEPSLADLVLRLCEPTWPCWESGEMWAGDRSLDVTADLLCNHVANVGLTCLSRNQPQRAPFSSCPCDSIQQPFTESQPTGCWELKTIKFSSAHKEVKTLLRVSL